MNRYWLKFGAWINPNTAAHANSSATAGLDVIQSRLLTEAHSKALRTNRLVSSCLIVLLLWASLAEVPQAAHGQARIIPSQRLQVVQAVDGGIITQISVQEGSTVKAGQILLQIDTTRFNSSLNEKVVQETSLRIREARLQAQLNKRPLEVPQSWQTEHVELVEQEKALLQTKLREWEAVAQITNEQLQQRQRELEEAQSVYAAAQRSFELLHKELQQTRPLLKSGAVSPVEMMRVERDVAKAEGDAKAAQAQINRLNSSILEARQKIQESRLKLENEARQELSEVKSRLASLGQNKVELSDRVNQATLRAPVDGLVQRILYNTKGAVVPAGREVIEIVPLDEELIFDTRVNPRDIGFMRPGQKAVIRVTAYDYTRYGAIQGTVDAISADSLVDEMGQAYYSIKVKASRSGLQHNLKLMPGMIAEVSIETEERRVISYLLKPLLRGFQESLTER